MDRRRRAATKQNTQRFGARVPLRVHASRASGAARVEVLVEVLFEVSICPYSTDARPVPSSTGRNFAR